jgi:hypothetical protein
VSGARLVLAGVAATALALAAAGCGGGSDPPSVASLGGSGTTTTGGGDSTGGGGGTASGGPQIGGSVVIGTKDGLAFSRCMRAHGVKNFPDPNSQGEIQIGAAAGINKGSPKFQSALQACRKVLPNGGQPTPAQLAAMRKAALAFSACMRSHGLPDFPDPDFSKGGAGIRLRGGPGSDLDPSSPAFQAAQKACQSKLPGKGAARTQSSGGG